MYKLEEIFSVMCKMLASTVIICGLAALGFVIAVVVYEVWLRSSVGGIFAGFLAVFAGLFLVMLGIGATGLVWTRGRRGQITPSS